MTLKPSQYFPMVKRLDCISRMEKMRYKMITVFLEEYDTINVKNYENMLSIILLLIKLKYNYTVKYDQTNYLKYSIILEN